MIAYTTGNESDDEEFKRVAQTRANEIRYAKGFDPKKDTVLVRSQIIQRLEELGYKPTTGQDLGKVGELSIVSHAGQDGPNFNYIITVLGSQLYYEQNPSGIVGLTVNWDSSARACLGCRTKTIPGRPSLSLFADRQGVLLIPG